MGILLLCLVLLTTGAGGATPAPGQATLDQHIALAPGNDAPHASAQAAPAATTGTVTYTYDEAGRLVGVDYGNGATIAYTYDAGGNLLQRTQTVNIRLLLPVVAK